METQNILVLKITGKLFDEDTGLLRKYVEVLGDLAGKYRIAVVCGGGGLARKYISMARSIGIDSNYWLDMIGIVSSRLNAYLLLSALRDLAYPKPAETLLEAQAALRMARIVFMGGLIPGQSTASVALEVAEAVGTNMVIDLSAVDKVYDKDPRRFPDAKPFNEIKISDLRRIIVQKQLPGEYALIDLRALDIAERSSIKIYIVYFKNPEKIHDVLEGENPGTIIFP